MCKMPLEALIVNEASHRAVDIGKIKHLLHLLSEEMARLADVAGARRGLSPLAHHFFELRA
jgi:hypothetical protein